MILVYSSNTVSTVEYTYVWCHVDDTFVTADDPSEFKALTNHLASKFDITITDNVSEYLGIKITKSSNGDVKLTQPKLLKSLLDEFSDDISLFRKQSSLQVRNEFQSTDVTSFDRTQYLHLVGALLYLCKSRPDIQTAVSFGATHSAAPTRSNFNELIRCLSYLRDTKDFGLVICAGQSNRPLKLRLLHRCELLDA